LYKKVYIFIFTEKICGQRKLAKKVGEGAWLVVINSLLDGKTVKFLPTSVAEPEPHILVGAGAVT
jgi:hypothetical protein